MSLDHESKIRRANDAKYILEHPLVVSALNALRADVYSKIEDHGSDDKALRALYHQLKAIGNFEAQFRFHVEEGKIAASMLEKWKAEQRLKSARLRG